MTPPRYSRGLGNVHVSEARAGAVPTLGNNPQRHALGLYAEQLSGTGFTRARAANRFVWVYRSLPSVALSSATEYACVDAELDVARDARSLRVDPHPGRWAPPAPPADGRRRDFVQGLRLFGEAGQRELHQGLAIYQYSLDADMTRTCASLCDGDLLLVPQSGGPLRVRTELGDVLVAPEEVAVVPAGTRFAVSREDPETRCTGYAAQCFNEGGFRLPETGLMGPNVLAAPEDFEVPVAREDAPDPEQQWTHYTQVGGSWFRGALRRGASPFDVAGWKGNLVPFRYSLRKFKTVNTVSFDHPDPSIFTVLTVPSADGGSACDLVVFPPRWMVAESTFRPPYFHRNTASEFMGLISGEYDGKQRGGGFVPGGASLHSRYTPHGPDVPVHREAVAADLKPVKFEGGLAFMFETCYLVRVSEWARAGPHRERTYASSSWGGFAPAAKL